MKPAKHLWSKPATESSLLQLKTAAGWLECPERQSTDGGQRHGLRRQTVLLQGQCLLRLTSHYCQLQVPQLLLQMSADLLKQMTQATMHGRILQLLRAVPVGEDTRRQRVEGSDEGWTKSPTKIQFQRTSQTSRATICKNINVAQH